ncbi:MAG: hypothetical protein AAGD07_11745 [Planctomycetota bacterium]
MMGLSNKHALAATAEFRSARLIGEPPPRTRRFASTLLALSVLLGCGGDIQQALPSLTSPIRGPGADDFGISATNVSRSDPKEFELPFPERSNPFAVGDRQDPKGNQPTAASSVEVLGFAKVGSQQVMLRVDEKVHFLVEGDSKGGVDVLQIRPPRVRLRNGNLTWEASMFEGGAHSLTK